MGVDVSFESLRPCVHIPLLKSIFRVTRATELYRPALWGSSARGGVLKCGCSSSAGAPGSGEEGVVEAGFVPRILGPRCGVNILGQSWAIIFLRIKPERKVLAQFFFSAPPKWHMPFPMGPSSRLHGVPFKVTAMCTFSKVFHQVPDIRPSRRWPLWSSRI